MYKVLVFGMTENPGGVESVIMNYWRHIDRTSIHFDFLSNSTGKIAYEEELKSNGSYIFHFPARSSNYFLYRKQLVNFFKNHSSEYDAIWVNVCSLANIDYLIFAKRYGIPKRIIHSHNSRNMNGKLRGLLHYINRNLISKYATEFWACSKESGKYFYSTALYSKMVIVNNAVDLDKFHYDEVCRNRIRNELGWGDCYIIGNIGRLHFQKNQEFLIDVFCQLSKTNDNTRLVIVGQGEDESKLKEKVRKLHLEEKCQFVGVKPNIEEWLSSFDLFFFPSLFEGLSLAPIEAQATGLVCLLSDKVIPKEVKINDNVFFLDLASSIDSWVIEIENIMKSYNYRISPNVIKKNFINANYDIETSSRRFEELLLGE